MSFSGTFGAVFKIAILCMVCNKLFCSVSYSCTAGDVLKEREFGHYLNALQCLKKNIPLTSEVPGLQPQCHSHNRSLMPVRQQ